MEQVGHWQALCQELVVLCSRQAECGWHAVEQQFIEAATMDRHGRAFPLEQRKA